MSLSFFESHIWQYYTYYQGPWFLEFQILQYYPYYTYYQGSLVFINSNIAILHILHVLPWVSLFLEVIFDNITHITGGPWFLEMQNLPYYIYYMYYHGSLFFGK